MCLAVTASTCFSLKENCVKCFCIHTKFQLDLSLGKLETAN